MERCCKEDLRENAHELLNVSEGFPPSENPIRFKKLLFVFSFILMTEGVLFLLCIPWGIHFHEPLQSFLWSATISILTGIGLFLLSDKRFEPVSGTREGFALITLSWIILILAGTLPYLFSHSFPKLVDVLYETTSGFTATGSSVIAHLEELPKSILFWRSLSHWAGGYFTLLMIIMVFPSVHNSGNHPFQSGINVSDLLLSNLNSLFKQITFIYVIITLVLFLLLRFEGMLAFNSFCYAFATVSTGSFITDASGPEDYSIFIQGTLMLFMLLSGIGYYSLLVAALRGRRFPKGMSKEIRYFLVFTGLAITVVCIGLFAYTGDAGDSIKVGIFQVLSFISGTGLSVSSYLGWTNFLIAFLVLLPILGSVSTSLSGGIKFYRLNVIGKQLKFTFRQGYTEGNNRNGNQIADVDRSVMSAMSITTLFIFITVLGTIVLSFAGISPHRAIFFAISSITTLGHNIGLAEYGNIEKIVMIIMMLAGRLEVYPILILLFPSFYSKKLANKN